MMTKGDNIRVAALDAVLSAAQQQKKKKKKKLMLNRPQKQWPMVDPVGRWRTARERERASCADYIAVVERDSIIHPPAV